MAEFRLEQFHLLGEGYKKRVVAVLVCLGREGRFFAPEFIERICAEVNAISVRQIGEDVCITCGFLYVSYWVGREKHWGGVELDWSGRPMWKRFVSSAWGCCIRCINTVYDTNKAEIDPLLPDFPRGHNLNLIVGWVRHVTQTHHQTNTLSDILAMPEVQEVVRAITPYVRAAGTARRVVRSKKELCHIYRY